MALDKSGLLSLISSDLPDNGNEEITASNLRVVLSQMVDSDLNLLEPSETVGINSRVIINQASDFDSYLVGGTYVLEGKKQYYIGDDIVVPGNFDLSAGSIVILSQAATGSITYTGTGDMFFGVDVGSAIIRDITLVQPSASAGDAIFNFSDTGPASIINVVNFIVGACDVLVRCQNIFGLTLDLGGVFSANNGIIIDGVGVGTLSLNKIFIASASPTFVGLDLGVNVFNAFEASDLQFIAPPGAFGISGLANNGNVLPGQVASIEGCSFIAGITPLSGLASNDFRYLFAGNAGIDDTQRVAFLTMNGNATNTVIASSATPVKVAGTFTEVLASHFATDNTGRIIYIAERATCVSIDTLLSAGMVAGTEDSTVFLAKGNTVSQPTPTVIANSGQVQELAAGDPRGMSTIWESMVVQDDFFEIWIQNDLGSQDILVSTAKFRIKL